MDSIANSDQERPDLFWRVQLRMKEVDTQGKLRQVLKDEFSKALTEETVIMSRKERKRLFAQLTRNIMEELLTDLEAGAG